MTYSGKPRPGDRQARIQLDGALEVVLNLSEHLNGLRGPLAVSHLQ